MILWYLDYQYMDTFSQVDIVFRQRQSKHLVVLVPYA